MNLADIRKKAEENRRTATAVSSGDVEESAQLPEMDVPEISVPAEPGLDSIQTPMEDSADDSSIFAFPLVEEEILEPGSFTPDIRLDDPFPGNLPASDVAAKVNEEECQPVLTVNPSIAKRLAGYNPLEAILSGRESASDADDKILFQSHSYGSEEIEEYLCFRVAHEEYAISIMAIKEIVKPREVTEVPRMPLFISGVLSLRGVIIPVMDMRIRLSLPASAATGRERIVVLKRDSGFCGVLVDEVIQVARVNKGDIEEPPAVLDGIDRDFVTGLGHFDSRILILLNLETILDIGVH
jgi:purine-binding chemotaxis protein CheW